MLVSLEKVLIWGMLGLTGYYLARVGLALLLVGLSRLRPSWRVAAVAVAPAAVRPLLLRAAAGGLVSLAITTTAAHAVAPPAADCGQQVPLLDRAPGCAQPPAAVPAAPTEPDGGAAGVAGDRSYTVARGDSLWEIAERTLGPGASTADIAAAWPVIWRANRAVVGPDPDRIMAGTVLEIPADLVGGAR